MLYTLVSFILNLSSPEDIPKINTTYTFKTLSLCENALDDKIIFINKKNNEKIFPEFILNKNNSKRILKITFTDKNIVSYNKCVKSHIAFNKEIFKENIN